MEKKDKKKRPAPTSYKKNVNPRHTSDSERKSNVSRASDSERKSDANAHRASDSERKSDANARHATDSERKNKGAPRWLKEKRGEEHTEEPRKGANAKRDAETPRELIDENATDGRTELAAGALLAPVPPAIVTVSDGERTNALTVGWCGILSTIPPRTYISVRPSRYSYPILKANGEFVINLPSSDMAAAVDLIGIYTGAKMDKIKASGLGTVPSKGVLPPTIKECPVALECRVCEIKQMGSHDVFIADIVNVTCQNRLIDDSGKLHYELADLLAYAHGEYFALGKRVGKFGFSTGKDEKRARISRTRKEKKNDG